MLHCIKTTSAVHLMLSLLKRWFSRLAIFRRWFLRRRAVGRGRWVEGEFSDPQGVLFYAPLLTPKRDYRLYVPADYDARAAVPLLVMLHGCKQAPLVFAAGTRMNELADAQGLLVLYPEQRRFANSYRCWNWFDPSAHSGKGEVALIAGMVREVCASYAVDAQRVYVAGLSAGGAMACILASTHADLFAACAVHSGLMFRAADSPGTAVQAMKHGSAIAPVDAARQAVQLAKPGGASVPVLVIHGSADETVNPVNADQIIEQALRMAEMSGVEGKAAQVPSSKTAGTHPGYPCEVRDYRYGKRLLARKVIVDGLGHAWSGGDGKHPFNEPKGPDASRMIWEFVTEFRREVAVDEAPRAAPLQRSL